MLFNRANGTTAAHYFPTARGRRMQEGEKEREESSHSATTKKQAETPIEATLECPSRELLIGKQTQGWVCDAGLFHWFRDLSCWMANHQGVPASPRTEKSRDNVHMRHGVIS